MGPGALFAFAAVAYAAPSLWLLRNYIQTAYDLGIYDQSIWLIVNGETFNTLIASHVIGVHFSPILFALSPIGLIPGGAAPEIILQSVLLAAGVVAAGKLALLFDKKPIWFMVAYALHPAIIGGSWYGVRPWNLAVAPFMFGMYFIARYPSSRTVVVVGLLALTFREDLAVWVMIGAVVLATAGRISWSKLVLPSVVLGLATSVVLFGLLSALSPVGSYFFSAGTETDASGLITDVSSLTTRLVFLVLPLGIRPSKLNLRLMVPLTLPALGLVILGGNALSTAYHYDMMFVPILLLVAGLSEAAPLSTLRTAILSIVVLATLGTLRPVPPMFGSNPFRIQTQATEQLDEISRALVHLDPTASLSLSAPQRLIPHFSERPNVFVFPSPSRQPASQSQPEAAVPYFRCPDPNLVVFETSTLDSEAWIDDRSEQYELVEDTGLYQLWIRNRTQPNYPCSAEWPVD